MELSEPTCVLMSGHGVTGRPQAPPGALLHDRGAVGANKSGEWEGRGERGGGDRCSSASE